MAVNMVHYVGPGKKLANVSFIVISHSRSSCQLFFEKFYLDHFVKSNYGRLTTSDWGWTN